MPKENYIEKFKSSKLTRFITYTAVILAVVVISISWNMTSVAKNRKTLKKSQTILFDGRLAKLPVSTTNLQAGGWGGLFTGESYMKFNATAEDIAEFGAESSSIKNVVPKTLDSEHMYLPMPDDLSLETEDDFENYKNNKYYNISSCPPWYRPTIKVKGRFYEIPSDPRKEGHNWGSVAIDDETNTVYVWVIWS